MIFVANELPGKVDTSLEVYSLWEEGESKADWTENIVHMLYSDEQSSLCINTVCARCFPNVIIISVVLSLKYNLPIHSGGPSSLVL